MPCFYGLSIRSLRISFVLPVAFFPPAGLVLRSCPYSKSYRKNRLRRCLSTKALRRGSSGAPRRGLRIHGRNGLQLIPLACVDGITDTTRELNRLSRSPIYPGRLRLSYSRGIDMGHSRRDKQTTHERILTV